MDSRCYIFNLKKLNVIEFENNNAKNFPIFSIKIENLLFIILLLIKMAYIHSCYIIFSGINLKINDQ